MQVFFCEEILFYRQKKCNFAFTPNRLTTLFQSFRMTPAISTSVGMPDIDNVTTGRLYWVDAMRGFAMVLVVFAHCMWPMGIGGESTFVGTLLVSFRMPLFFFVSGFFSYRTLSSWNAALFRKILLKKVQAQILGTACFLGIYLWMFDLSFEQDGIVGYWFTIVLFQMYIVYLSGVGLSKLFRTDIVLPVMVVVCVAFMWFYHFDVHHITPTMKYLCWQNLATYLQFFIVGIIASRYRSVLFKLLANSGVYATLLLAWVACFIVTYSNIPTNMEWIDLAVRHHIARYCGLFVVMSLFFFNGRWFASAKRGSVIARFIGRRTLDIYFIHYYFIPTGCLLFLGPWLSAPSNIVFQILLPLLLASVVLALSLGVSCLIHRSPTLTRWLLGA